MAARKQAAPHGRVPMAIAPRTLFVTGKGGVGKSTVAAALAMAYRNAGIRTLLVGIEGMSTAAGLISSRLVGYEPTGIGGGLHAICIDAESALIDYAQQHLKVRAVATRLARNKIFSHFAAVAPGLRELLVLGKLWSMSQLQRSRGSGPKWEAMIVDAPSTGHGVGLLGMAGTIARAFPVGPIAHQAKAVDTWVRDPEHVGAVVVALPEEIPISETIDLHDALTEQGTDIAAIIVNCVLHDRLRGDEVEQLTQCLAAHNPATADESQQLVANAVQTALFEHDRVLDQQEQIGRLIERIANVHMLPYRYGEQIQRGDVAHFAGLLADAEVENR